MSYNSGEGVPSPIGRDIDGKYLDENEDEITTLFKKWQNEWKEHGVTVMCDSWTGPTRMSIINFLLYSNDTKIILHFSFYVEYLDHF